MGALHLRRCSALLFGIVASVFWGSSFALFADQAGNADWTLQNVGSVRHAAFLHPKSRYAFVGTDAGVIAALHPRTGAITWRHVLPQDEEINAIHATDSLVISLSAKGSRLYGWDSRTGSLLWDASLPPATSSSSPILRAAGSLYAFVVSDGTIHARLLSEPASDAWSVQVEGRILDVVVASDSATVGYEVCAITAIGTGDAVLDGVAVTCHGAADGAKTSYSTFSSRISASSVVAFPSSSQGVHVMALSVRGDEVAVFSLRRQEFVTQTIASLLEDGLYPSSGGSMKAESLFSPFAESSSSVRAASSPVESNDAFPVVLALSDGGFLVVGVDADLGVRTQPAVPRASISAATVGNSAAPVVFGATFTVNGVHVVAVQSSASNVGNDNDGTIRFLLSLHVASRATSAGKTADAQLPSLSARGQIARVFPSGFLRSSDTEVSLRTMLSMEDDSLCMLQAGAVLFDRPEFLASFRTIEAVDEPAKKSSLLNIEEPLLTPKVLIGLAAIRGYGNGRNGGYKIAGLHSADGKVLWSVWLPNPDADARAALFVSRPRAFGPHAAEVGVIQSLPSVRTDANGARWGVKVSYFNAWTGEPTGSSTLAVVPSQVTPLPDVTDSTNRMCVLVSGSDSAAHILPSSSDAVGAFEAFRPNFSFHTARVGNTVVQGMSVVPSTSDAVYMATPLWQLRLGDEQTVVAVAEPPHPSASHTATPAVVLGDDSLLTKYLNPNMIGILSSSHGNYGPVDSVVEVRLVDTVSGRVVMSRFHEHASTPVHALREENWLVYTYWNTKAKRTELGAVSLYQDSVARLELNPLSPREQAAHFSSFSAVDPIILHQSFVAPGAVDFLAHTRTHRGVTSPHVIMALRPGAVLVMDRLWIDPRRPLGTPDAGEKEEHLRQYTPFLPVTHKTVVTYNQTIPGIRTIGSFPTALESTTFLVAAGVDVFFTPSAPAKAFDVLAADFNKPLLASLTIGLCVVTLIARFFAMRKEENLKWQ